MATAATLRRVDVNLRSIKDEVDFLPTLADTWDSLSEDNQLTYLIEWSELMDRLCNLAKTYSSDKMTPAQQARYKALLTKLTENKPIIERLELRLPPVLI